MADAFAERRAELQGVSQIVTMIISLKTKNCGHKTSKSARRLLLGRTTESNSCGQQVAPFRESKGVLLLSLVGGRGGLCDVANVVLEELPITSAFHPDVRAAVSRLPVDTTAVRHDR